MTIQFPVASQRETANTIEEEKLMTSLMLLGYVAVIIISYQGAVFALKKANLL